MSLDVLTLIDVGLVTGGGKDDCVCFTEKKGNMIFTLEIPHDDINDENICIARCCADEPFGKYMYKNGPIKKCR